MTFFENLGKKIKAANGDTYAKGDLFEDHVLKMFPPEFFTIIEATHSTDDLNGRGTESCRNPDFHLRDKKTKTGFWVECKFRSSTFEDGSIQWCEPYQLKTYKKAGETTQEKVFVMIGIGGKPHDPEKIYLIDLNKTPYNKLFRSAYIRNEILIPEFKSLEHLEKQIP